MARFLYNTCNFDLHIFPIKRFLGKDDSDFEKIVANFEKRQHIKNPSRKLKKKYEYQEKQLGGQPCYCFRPKDNKIERAVLLMFIEKCYSIINHKKLYLWVALPEQFCVCTFVIKS